MYLIIGIVLFTFFACTILFYSICVLYHCFILKKLCLYFFYFHILFLIYICDFFYVLYFLFNFNISIFQYFLCYWKLENMDNNHKNKLKNKEHKNNLKYKNKIKIFDVNFDYLVGNV